MLRTYWTCLVMVACLTSGCIDDGTRPGDLVAGRSRMGGFSATESMVSLYCHQRGASAGQYNPSKPCLHAVVALIGNESDVLDVRTSGGNIGLGVWQDSYTVEWVSQTPAGQVTNTAGLLFDGRNRIVTVFEQDYSLDNGCIFVLEVDVHSGKGIVHQLTAGSTCDLCRLSPDARRGLLDLECGY